MATCHRPGVKGIFAPGRTRFRKNTCHGPGAPLHPAPSKSTSNQPPDSVRSQHKSLQSAKGIAVKRNVLKRFERVELLKKRGQWKEGQRIVGLKKTKPEV